MIRDAHEANATVTPTEFEIDRLRTALPEYFGKDGSFMLDRLQDALRAGEVNLSREGYELKFLGKSYAKYLTSTKTETVVVPDLAHNAESANATSENLYIVGDNLDALKQLYGSYESSVKCIYIDPPYNTGKDGFVYNDDFGFSAADLVAKIGLDEDEARRVTDLHGKSSHSAWLTFMYPRLELAKELLMDKGVIFISVDDNEQANARLLCDEVFGEGNWLGTLVWKNATDNNPALPVS
uniref:DNA methyltransferase n=1 Tax=Corynebacterium nuruki TaxID=1032851 RepID=UPI0039BF2080